MLLGRRNPESWSEKVRVWLWPRRNWSRSARYIVHRLRRLRATPHKIALGCACGVFASFTPYMGGHLIIGGFLAWITRSSMIAAALGTFVGNPLTFPFIWLATYHLGSWVLGQPSNVGNISLSSSIFDYSMHKLWPLVKPMTVGGIPLGILAGSVAYFIVRKVSESYRKKSRKRALGRGRPAGASMTNRRII